MKTKKKLVCALAAAACMTAAAGAAVDLGNLPPEGAQAYLETIESLQKIWGQGKLDKKANMWQGLSLVKLVDFDGDKIPELYCGTSDNNDDFKDNQRLYTWDGSLKRLNLPAGITKFGTDVSIDTLIYIRADRAYIVCTNGGIEMWGDPVQYYTKQGDQMIVALTYTNDAGIDGGEPDPPTLNGKQVSATELERTLKDFTAGMDKYFYSYYYSKYYSKRNPESGRVNVNGTVEGAVAALQNRAGKTATVNKNDIKLNGEPISLAAYTIDGNNYFKLRDLAMALSGTETQFEVGWDENNQRIRLTSASVYTPTGNEGKGAPAASVIAHPSKASVWLDGTELKLQAYEINGNNFFKLRDLGAALHFNVIWEEETKTIYINTEN